MKRWVAILVSILLGMTGGQLAAEEPHLELVHGLLRDRHSPDLALEYLEKLTKNPPAGLAELLPFEMALVRLELAMQEPDLARRDVLYAQARGQFEAFLQKNAKHPLAAKANFEIARVIALLGKSQFARSRQQDSRAARETEAQKASALFVEAGAKLQAAITQLDAQLAKDPEPKTKESLERARLDAEFEQGINLLEQAQTEADILKRGETVQKAIGVLKKLAAREESGSLGWIARAWIGRCYQEIDNNVAARKELNAVIAQEGEVADASRRLARYFRLQLIKDDPQIKNPHAELVKAADEWLKIYRRHHDSPEGCGVRWELANAYFTQAQKMPLAGIKKDQLDAKARGLYIEAQKIFRSLEETENDFTERARNRKLRIMLILSATRVGEKVEFNPAALKTFEEAHLWAQYEGFQIGEEEKELAAVRSKLSKEELEKREKLMTGNRKRHLKNAVDSLHRALQLADAKVAARDIVDVRSMLAYAYLTQGNPFRAAVVGEDLARAYPKASRAASAAGYALQAYAQIVADDERAGLADKEINADRERLRQLAQYMEQTWPDDASTNAARHQLAAFFLRDKKYPEAIAVLQRVNVGYPLWAHTRYQLASATLELLKEKDKAKQLTDADRRALQDQAVATLRSVPEAPSDADPDTCQIYVLARLQLGGILYEAKQFDQVEAVGNELKKNFDKLQLGDEIKAKLKPEV
ncbi:MAG TPA: hypothetical protein VKI65_14295, partial [Gemmataceae bacterium]|nr:hypothetical protein [Gemmataceae bacterium]